MYYSELTYPIVDFEFNSVADMKKFQNFMSKPLRLRSFGISQLVFQFWENDIDPIRKFHFLQGKLNYCDWLSIDRKNCVLLNNVSDSDDKNDDTENKTTEHTKLDVYKISNTQTEEYYIRDYKTITKLTGVDTSAWITLPKILSFDIETYSHNPLVMPESTLIEDEITMITITLSNYKDKTSKKIVLTIGQSLPIEKDIHVEYFSKEKQMLEKFLEIIAQEDPTIITGYNIFSYDIPYIDQRIKILLDKETWGNIGVLVDQPCEFKPRKLESKAYGTNITVNTDMISGRLLIDMLTVMRLDYPGLESHTLNAVCEKFCARKKLDLPAKKMFEIHRRFLEIKDKYSVNKHTKKDTYLDICKSIYTTVSEDLKLSSSDIETISSKHNISHEETTNVYNLLKDYKMFIDYGVRDADLVDALFNRLEIWIILTVSGNIYGINPIDVYNRGQIHRAKSRLYFIANDKNYFLNARKLTDEGKYKGAYVAEPEVGRHHGVACYDFASLYPSIMIAYNICPSTMIEPTQEDLQLEETWKRYYMTIEEIEKLTQDITKSQKTLAERKFVEKIMETLSVDEHVNKLLEGDVEKDNVDTKSSKSDDISTITKLTATQKKKLQEMIKLKTQKKQLDSILGKVDEIQRNEDRLNTSIVNIEYFKNNNLPPPEELKILDEITPFKNDVDDEKLALHTISGVSYDAAENKYRVSHKFVMAHKRKGLIPESVEDLLKERKRVRNQLKELQTEEELCRPDADPVLYAILDQTQLRLKVAANSTYGFLGALKTNGYSNKGCAESVTIKGYNSIKLLNYTLNNKYNARVVYNDTDSAFIVFDGVEKKDVMTRAKDVLSEINGQKPGSIPLFRPPMKLEFEKAMIVIFICKKKYPFYLLDKNGNIVCDGKGKPVYKKKGITSARRDNCKWATEHVDTLSKKILDGCSFEDAMNYCKTILDECLDETVPIQKLIFKNRIRTTEYKVASNPLNLFIETRKQLGKPVVVGETVEFVYVDNGEEKAGKKMYDLNIYKDKLEDIGLKFNKDGLLDLVEDYDKVLDEKKQSIHQINLVEDVKGNIVVEYNDKLLTKKKYIDMIMRRYNIPKIDYMYYLKNRVVGNVDQIFYAGFKQVSDKITDLNISYTPLRGRNCIYFNTPLEAVVKICEDEVKYKTGRVSRSYINSVFSGVMKAVCKT
jgi:DNA polymerase elongation subunit (family B)